MSEPHAHPHVPDAGELSHTLTKKLGPLPVWAWGAGIGAVLVIFLWLHNRDNTGPVTAYDNTATADGMDGDLEGSNSYDDAYNSGYSAGAGSGGGSSGDSTSDDGTDTTGANPDGTAPGKRNRNNTNDSWLRRTVAALVADGRNPLRVSRILNRYLSGQGPRNKQERRIVNQAIKESGLPPQVPQNVSHNNHQQHASGGAHGDHPVNPHTSNAQPHHNGGGQGGGHGGGWGQPPRPHQGQHQHHHAAGHGGGH